MSKYGMTKEEYSVWSSKDPWESVEGWIEYSWETWLDGSLSYSYMYFPSEKVAKAYFAAHKITDYYLETI